MIKGLYHSGSAMIPRIKKQEVIANNLANVSSPGYKKDLVFTQELSRAQSKRRAQPADWQRPMIDQVYTTFEQGSLDKTDNPLDLALEGRGFFAFETEDGAVAYSRAGNLTVDSFGFLINPEGHRLLGQGGPIGVAGGPVSISESGQVEVDNTAVANIRVVDFDDLSVLQKTGKTEFMIPEGIEPRAAVEFTIKQGYLESSNVDVIREMIDMIISFRNYEADAQSAKTQDESLEKLINNVGRIR
jgi:flagellar basal-body rod protein FlgG